MLVTAAQGCECAFSECAFRKTRIDVEKGISLGVGNGCFFMAAQAFLMVTKYAIVCGHGDDF